MSDIAIVVEGLGKRYRIGETLRYKALLKVLKSFISDFKSALGFF